MNFCINAGKPVIRLATLVVCIFLCACQHSPPKQYFMLSVMAPTEPPHNSQLKQPITNMIGLGPIEVAAYLQRPQLIFSEANNQLILSNQHNWAEPLEKGIARVLTLNLTQYNNARSFSNFPWRSDNKPTYSLRLQIHSLGKNNDQATINATWELINNTHKSSIARQHFVHSTQASPGPQGLVSAYSQLLADFAAELNVALDRLP